MSDIDLNKALDALADYADLVWDATGRMMRSRLISPMGEISASISCHLAHQPTTRWRRPATRRVWGRWT